MKAILSSCCRSVTVLLVCALAGGLAAGCGKKSEPPAQTGVDLSKPGDLFTQPIPSSRPKMDPSTVMVTVNGKDITRGEVDEDAMKMVDLARRRMPPEQVAQMEDQFVQQALDQLVLRILLTEAVDQEKIDVTDDEIQKAIAQFKESLPPDMKFEDVLTRNGWDEERFLTSMKLDLRINKLFEQKAASVEMPTDDELTKFYEDNRERFDMPETVAARHILIAFKPDDTDEAKAAKRKTAEEVREKLVAGGDFAALAAEFSDDPGSKTRGGDLGVFPRGRMVKPFEEAAFTQKTNDIGQVVETAYGFHIIQVTDHKEPHLAPLEEVKERLSTALHRQKQQEVVREYVKGLREKASIQFPGGQPPMGMMAPPPGMQPTAAPQPAPAAPQPAPAAP